MSNICTLPATAEQPLKMSFSLAPVSACTQLLLNLGNDPDSTGAPRESWPGLLSLPAQLPLQVSLSSIPFQAASEKEQGRSPCSPKCLQRAPPKGQCQPGNKGNFQGTAQSPWEGFAPAELCGEGRSSFSISQQPWAAWPGLRAGQIEYLSPQTLNRNLETPRGTSTIALDATVCRSFL